MVNMNIFLTGGTSTQYKHKRTAKRLFYAPHVAKRPSKRIALVIYKRGKFWPYHFPEPCYAREKYDSSSIMRHQMPNIRI